MTVVPDDEAMRLICDGCGETVAGPAPVLPDAEVVWMFVSDHGWSGSPFATGPHRCPRCDLAPVPDARATPRETGSGARADRKGTGSDARAGRNDRTERGPDHPRTGLLGVDRLDGVSVITLAGDVNGATGDALHTALTSAVETGGAVVVDLTRVRLIDSTGLGLLVRAHRWAKEGGVRLCLAAPSRFILTVLHTMRLDGVFPIFDSRQDALRQLSRPAQPAGVAGPAGTAARPAVRARG